MKKRLGIVCVVVLVLAIGWWLVPRGERNQRREGARPSVVKIARQQAMVLRPQAVPASVTPVEAPKAEVSQLINVIVGQDEGTAHRYVARSEAIWKLGKELPEEAVEALLVYLRSTEDVLREERVDALKNDILNVLRAQKRISPKLAETLIVMFDSQAYGVAMLDYCIQHLGALQEATATVEERNRIYDCLWRAALVPGASYAGTALIALTHTPDEDDDRLHFLNERVTALIYAEDTHPAARVTAVQIAAERGYAEVLPVLRRMAVDQSAAVPLRIVAIGALGTFREVEDGVLLARLRGEDPNPRLRPAIERAIECCQETKEL